MELRSCKKSLMTGEWHRPFFQVSIPWIVGLFIGAYIAFRLSDEQQQMIRLIASKNASLLGVLCSSFVSFLIIILAARFMGHRWIQACLFIKSTLFSLCFCYCSRCFGTSGWLVSTLLFFADLICSYCLLLFSFQLFKSKQRVSKLVLIPYSVISILFGMFNFFVLSPFTASLF